MRPDAWIPRRPRASLPPARHTGSHGRLHASRRLQLSLRARGPHAGDPIGTRPDGVPKPALRGARPRQVDDCVVIALVARPAAVAPPTLGRERSASASSKPYRAVL